MYTKKKPDDSMVYLLEGLEIGQVFLVISFKNDTRIEDHTPLYTFPCEADSSYMV